MTFDDTLNYLKANGHRIGRKAVRHQKAERVVNLYQMTYDLPSDEAAKALLIQAVKEYQEAAREFLELRGDLPFWNGDPCLSYRAGLVAGTLSKDNQRLDRYDLVRRGIEG